MKKKNKIKNILNFKIEGVVKKKLYNALDSAISNLVGEGNSFFALTINFQKSLDLNNYESESERLFELIKTKTKSLSFLYVVYEVNDKKNNHLHGVIVLKNIIDYNKNFTNNLTHMLREYYEIDSVVKPMPKFIDVKNWIANYLWKDVDNWNLTSLLWFSSYKQQSVAYLLDMIEEVESSTLFRCKVKGFSYGNKILNEFCGCQIINNKIEQSSVLGLIQYYLYFNKLFIYRDNLYKKITEYLISYKKVGSIQKILYEDFYDNVAKYFILQFPLYFKDFDFNKLTIDYLHNKKKDIEEIKILTTNRIEPDFSLIEFTDGVYSIKYNKFIPKENFQDNKNEFSTVKFYNRTHKHLDKPKRWVKDVCGALQIEENSCEENNTFVEVCCYIANIFHKNKTFFSKKKVLYIHGETNTYKSTLIAKPLISFFGMENVGFISDSRNFKFQHLLGKKLGVMDEFKYQPKLAPEYLKLFAGEITITEQKYSVNHQIIEDLPIIIISNSLIEEKNKEIKDALFSRIFAVEFKKSMQSKKDKNETVDTTRLSEQIDLIIKEEEPKIIKYCNQIFYKSKYKTKTRVETKRLMSELKKDSFKN